MSRLRGASRLRRTLKRWPEDVTAEVRTEMRAAAMLLETSLEARAPKDEGDLARAARGKVSKDGLGLKAGYSGRREGFVREWKRGGFVSVFAERGTKHHSAQPFIRETWRARIGGILDRIDRAVANSLRKAKGG